VPFGLRGDGAINWMEITHEDYLQYMTTSIGNYGVNTKALTSTGSNGTGTLTRVTTLLQEFEKGIHRDDPHKSASYVTANAIGLTFVPPHLRTPPSANVLRSTMMTTDKTMINTVAHNICAEVTGGEIKSHKCNSGEASNTHTMIGSHKYNYGETNKEQTAHGRPLKTAPI
jgi:hypothetical protein